MTHDTFLVTDLSEIHSIRLDCVACGASKSYNPAKAFHLGVRCHQCGADVMDAATKETVEEFMTSLKRTRELKGGAFTLNLVFRERGKDG